MTFEPETRTIPVEGPLAQLGAMAYFAVLAYPRRQEWPKRNELVEALKAHLFKAYIARFGDRQTILPKYRQMKNEKIGGIISQATYRLQAMRLPAAQMAYWRMMHGRRIGPIVIKFKPPKKEYWARKFSVDYLSWEPRSINDHATLLAAELENARAVWNWHDHKDAKPLLQHANSSIESSSKNVLHRVWKGTMPVLHLAMAFPKEHKDLDIRTQMHRLVFDPSWLSSTLRRAEALRCTLPQFISRYDSEMAIRLLPLAYNAEDTLRPQIATDSASGNTPEKVSG